MSVENSVYESAVKGRQDMRGALRIEREKTAKLIDLLKRADEAINPPDRGGISMEKWNVRLKAITAEIRLIVNTN